MTRRQLRSSPADTRSAKRMAPPIPLSMSAANLKAPPSKSKDWAGAIAFGSGKGVDTISSGLEVAWTHQPGEVGQQLS